jgi:radical SAM protein with 4Fe4S-binding SPASM domain
MGGFQCRQIKYGLYVDVKGDVWECNAGELHLGNIRQDKLKDLWLSKKALDFRKKWDCGNCHIREKYWGLKNVEK